MDFQFVATIDFITSERYSTTRVFSFDNFKCNVLEDRSFLKIHPRKFDKCECNWNVPACTYRVQRTSSKKPQRQKERGRERFGKLSCCEGQHLRSS